MPWVEIVHACPTPGPAEIKGKEARAGSRWACDSCGDVWVLRQLREKGADLDDPKWTRTTPQKGYVTR